MIITRTPFRVPLGGGGTDLPLTPDVNSGHETLSHAATCLA